MRTLVQLQLAPSPLHSIFFAMASSSSMNSNVSKVHREVHREADDFRKVDQGCALSAVAREFGVDRTTVTDIRKSREKDHMFAAC